MKFYEYESDWAYHKGEWCESAEDCPLGFESEDLELCEMSLEPDECGDEDDFVFNFWDWQDPKDNWFCHVTIPDDEKFGTPEHITWKVYIDGEFAGYVELGGGNECENILLGIYDVIECWFTKRDVFGVTR